jgi:hypothetical protein
MRLDPSEAYDRYVGDQTPDEFMALSIDAGHKTPEEAVSAYIDECAAGMGIAPEIVEDVKRALARYIRESRKTLAYYLVAQLDGEIVRWRVIEQTGEGQVFGCAEVALCFSLREPGESLGADVTEFSVFRDVSPTSNGGYTIDEPHDGWCDEVPDWVMACIDYQDLVTFSEQVANQAMPATWAEFVAKGV